MITHLKEVAGGFNPIYVFVRARVISDSVLKQLVVHCLTGNYNTIAH